MKSSTSIGIDEEYILLPTLAQMQKKREVRSLHYVDQQSAPPVCDNEKIQQEIEQAHETAQCKLIEAREAAQKQAQQLIELANDQKEAICNEARESGFDAGMKEAQEALAAVSKQLDAAYADAIERLEQTGDLLFVQVKDSILKLALNMAEKITGYAFDRNEQIYESMVRQALSHVVGQHKIVLRVSPWEYTRFFAQEQCTLTKELKTKNIEVLEDAQLQKAQIQIDTEFGFVGAGIELQLKRLGFVLSEGV